MKDARRCCAPVPPTKGGHARGNRPPKPFRLERLSLPQVNHSWARLDRSTALTVSQRVRHAYDELARKLTTAAHPKRGLTRRTDEVVAPIGGSWAHHRSTRLKGYVNHPDLRAVQAFAVATSRVNGSECVVDLGGLTFIDSCGLRGLWQARIAHPGIRYVNPSAPVRRVLEMTELDRILLDR
jgi:anti-anti-sigma factor